MLTPDEVMDKPFGGADDTGRIALILDTIMYYVVWPPCKLIMRFRFENRESLRELSARTGAIVACNHTSYLDIPFMWMAPRFASRIRIMARDKLFTNRVAAQFLARCGAFPVSRDSADLTSVKRAVRMLKNRELVGIFPEGTRRGKGNLEPSLHAGVALIARMAKAPIVPCGISGADQVKVKGDWRIHFPRVRYRIGAPVEVSWFDFLPKDERLEACTWYVMRECFALARDVASEDVDMTELFPGARDFAPVFAEHPVGEGA